MSMTNLCSFGITFFILLGLAVPASGKSFMPRADTREEVEASLLAELSGTFRSSATKDHIMTLENALRPMYSAVPKETDGTLRNTVVRYVLHRFFAQRGWFVRGLEPGGNATSTSDDDSLQDLQGWVPAFLTDFLGQISGGRGISLRELAVLAATLEDLIHKETLNRLETAYQKLELSLDEKLDDAHVREALEVFMMIYQLGGADKFQASGPAAVRRAHNIFTKKVKDWEEIQEWMHSVLEKMYPYATSLDFDAVSRVAEEIGAKYGSYNRKECGSLKADLLHVESQKAGRVRLADFYKKGLTGVFEFNEKADYLRVIGALDESDPEQPHVIVANYVSSRSNCLAASDFYAVCCRNECEDIMGKLESTIAAEMATPDQIIQLVSGLSSLSSAIGEPRRSVESPRKLSTTLTQRLHSIAETNDGYVPLHGRLFAQWIHHAFPRECPFPHVGAPNPQTPDEWMRETGQETNVETKEERMTHVINRDTTKPIGAKARQHHHFEENELPWSEDEELLAPRNTGFTSAGTAGLQQRSFIETIAVFAMVISLASVLVYGAKPLVVGQAMARGQKVATTTGASNSVDFIKETCKMA